MSARDTYRRDAMDRLAGYAHEDAEPDDAESGKRHDRSRRTAHHWRKNGPPPVREFQSYMFNSPDPYRLVAQVKTMAKAQALKDKTDDELIASYHDLLPSEKERESDDTKLDLCRRSCWLDKARASERDAALDEEKAAHEFEFAARRISYEQVWGSDR